MIEKEEKIEEKMEEKSIVTLYWYYRLRMDALKKMMDVQHITPNEIHNLSKIHSNTVDTFMTSIVSHHLILRFECTIFAVLQRRLDYYAINARNDQEKNMRVKKIFNDASEVITSWEEARDYMERKQIEYHMAKAMFETTYLHEICDETQVYPRHSILKQKLNELHLKLKDQPMPKEYQEESRQEYERKEHLFKNLGLS